MIALEEAHCPLDDDLYWFGCYDSDARYKKFIHKDTYAHPAKMSMLLLNRILKHLEKHGLLRAGGTIVDFMAGTSRTGIAASLHGCKYVGVELEPHFVEMSRKNQAVLEKRLNQKVDWELIEGDARHLSEILSGGGVGVVSPPWGSEEDAGGSFAGPNSGAYKKRCNEYQLGFKGTYRTSMPYPSNPSNIGNLKDKPLVGVVSPPYGDSEASTHTTGLHFGRDDYETLKDIQRKRRREQEGGGNNYMIGYRGGPMNIGNLRDAPLVGITSPPYTDIGHIAGKNADKELNPERLEMQRRYTETMRSEGNIQNLPDKPLVGITSPPYHETGNKIPSGSITEWKNKTGEWRTGMKYSRNINNIGNQEETSYLSAMLQVYGEAYKAGISPLVVTTKNPTRDGQLRRLDLDTMALLVQSGYRIVDYHRAVLWDYKKQWTLDGNVLSTPKGRISFFKRLSLSKGSVAAQWEDILFADIPRGTRQEAAP